MRKKGIFDILEHFGGDFWGQKGLIGNNRARLTQFNMFSLYGNEIRNIERKLGKKSVFTFYSIFGCKKTYCQYQEKIKKKNSFYFFRAFLKVLSPGFTRFMSIVNDRPTSQFYVSYVQNICV